MNIVIWVLAGSVLGWIGFSFFRYSVERGMLPSIIIGGAGAIAGGKLSESLFSAAAVPGAFSMPALLLAATVAATLLLVANSVEKRWGI